MWMQQSCICIYGFAGILFCVLLFFYYFTCLISFITKNYFSFRLGKNFYLCVLISSFQNQQKYKSCLNVRYNLGAFTRRCTLQISLLNQGFMLMFQRHTWFKTKQKQKNWIMSFWPPCITMVAVAILIAQRRLNCYTLRMFNVKILWSGVTHL